MRFRFQIVCSAFHKGRIKVVYDPNYFATNEYNTNYLTIVDIADKTDFTVEVANGQDYTTLAHALPGLDSVTEMYSTTPYIAPLAQRRSNGVLGVYVVNELTTPNSTINNDIEVNVFVSMGDDFEVFVPDDHFQYFVAKPQSGMELVPESQNTSESSAPQHEEAEKLGPTKSDNSEVNMVFTGEAIASFRTLLKRCNLWTSISPKTSLDKSITGRFSMYPFLRGNVLNAVHTASGGAPYNFCNTILLHWVVWAYSGWRGSIRYKWLPRGRLENSEMPALYVQRHPVGQLEYARTDINPKTYANDSQAGASAIVSLNVGGLPTANAPFGGTKGQVYSSGYLNPAIEFEVPYYSPLRFTPGKQEDHTGINEFNEGYDYYLQCDASDSTVWDIHVSGGEDFQTYFFTGLPRLYYEPTPPAPVL